ncbi:MAG: nitrogenase molybdenum-iron protein subunit beta, partial [Nitrospinota bacterium]
MSNQDKCSMPTEEWINTEEYKEKNFARKNLVVNPAKGCQPFGAIFAACGFEGTMPFVHGSQGCVAYFRNNFSRHFREPFSTTSTSMTEDAAVFGGQANLIEGLKNTYALYKPKMIALSTSCIAEVIGDDLNAFINNARNKQAIPDELPTPFASTPSFVGSHITGYDNMLKGILTYLTKDKKTDKKTDKINIIPGFDTHVGNLREIKRILNLFGVEYTILADNTEYLDSPLTGEFDMYPGGTPLEETRESINNKATIALQRYSTKKTITFIEKFFEHEAVALPMPIGIGATDKLVMEISRITGKEIPKEIEDERG